MQRPTDDRELFQKMLSGACSPEETEQVINWLQNATDDPGLDRMITDEFRRQLNETLDPLVRQKLLARLPAIFENQPGLQAPNEGFEAGDAVPVATDPPVHRIHFLQKRWLRYAAALIIFGSAGAYFYFSRVSETGVAKAVKEAPANPDAMPGADRAMLMLANGQRIVLDSAHGNIMDQGNLKVVNEQGKLDYEGRGDVVEYHTLSTPRGGQYQLKLPDGTSVWLNAASSVTFPTAFKGSERKISITGEVYLDVAKDKKRPFKVSVNNNPDIEALGTQFNVSAYHDEEEVRTTLVEGSIRVSKSVLKPGQAYANGKVMEVDVNQVTAWKNGVFNFHHMKLEAIMRQISRWYDIEVVYEKGVPRIEFFGELGMDLQLSQVLNALKSSEVNFKIDKEKRLIVMP